MSQRYATIAAERLRTDPTLTTLATGGVLDRDPRRGGADATEEVFATDAYGDIKPTVACAGRNATQAIGGPDTSFSQRVTVMLFVPDAPAFHDTLDQLAERVTVLLWNYAPGNVSGLFRWDGRMGMLANDQFADVAYDEVRFRVIGLHEGVPT